MPIYRLKAELTIKVFTFVNAKDEMEAKELAFDRELGEQPHDFWVRDVGADKLEGIEVDGVL